MATAPAKINLSRLAHVFYTYKDVQSSNQFLLDFGLTIVDHSGVAEEGTTYFRGYGIDPFLVCSKVGPEDVFEGAAFIVESFKDLELASTLPNASEITDLSSPGGGKSVSFRDPVDGFKFHLVWGQAMVEATEPFPQLDYNYPTVKNRPVNKVQRFQKSPSPIHKLGHFGLCVTNYQRAFDFFTTHFNFQPSEIVHGEDGVDNVTFLHLDRGEEWVDHHCLFFFEGPVFHVHHSSFEVHDFDTQVLGHDFLRAGGYELVWGPGRHVMGTQLFDYWRSPSGFIMEHYADGDLVNNETKVNRTKASPDSLHVWGPPLPPTFLL